MRVIKQNTKTYSTLYESLKGSSRDESSLNTLRALNLKQERAKREKYLVQKDNSAKNFFEIVSDCESKIHSSATIENLIQILSDSISKLLPNEESGIFLFDDFNLQLNSLTKDTSEKANLFINNIFKEEILDWIFETGKPALIPDIEKYTGHGSRLNFYILPIYENKKNKGLLFVLTPLTRIEDDSAEARTIKMILSLIFPKILIQLQRKSLKSLYSDLQSYQSKLNNDYKLSAIGELTNGIIENILSPLQIIISYADMIGESANSHDLRAVNSIKGQVKKIEGVINRLAKFSSLNNQPEKLFSCNINELTSNFCEVIKSSLNNKNYELIVDLDDNIPPILTHPDYFNQILSNTFSLLRPKSPVGGGILVQTRFSKDLVHLRIISTDFNKKLSANSENSNESEIRILNNLVKKHEGSLKFDSKQSAGTSILFKLPLKRKLRK